MRVLATARHPGAAEAVAPVVDGLRSEGHEVLLIGVSNDAPENRAVGGSAAVFERAGTEFVELFASGYRDSAIDVPRSYASGLVDSFAPDRVLVGCSAPRDLKGPGIEEALLAAGVRASIRTVQISEGWGVWRHVPGTPNPSAWAAFDNITAKAMAARGVPVDRLFVTGHPGLDGYANAAPPRSAELRDELGVDGYRAVLFFGQAQDAEGARSSYEALAWIVDCIGPDDQLVFARHPRDTVDYGAMRERAKGRMIEPGIDSHRLMAAADICISQYSTMALKSALLGIPTISITHPDDFPELRDACGGIPLCVAGGSSEAASPGRLRELLRGTTPVGASILRAALNIDGQATERVMELVTGNGV